MVFLLSSQALAGEPDLTLLTGGAAPPDLEQLQLPIGVLVFGVSPMALFGHPAIMEVMEITPERIAVFESKLQLAPGITTVIFGDPQEPEYIWVMGRTMEHLGPDRLRVEIEGLSQVLQGLMSMAPMAMQEDGHAICAEWCDRRHGAVDVR